MGVYLFLMPIFFSICTKYQVYIVKYLKKTNFHVILGIFKFFWELIDDEDDSKFFAFYNSTIYHELLLD